MGNIGPDDLPEDPFGPSGTAQVVCGCTSDTYHLVLTASTVRVICANCRVPAAEFPRHTDIGPHQGWPGQGDRGMAQRDMLPNAPVQHTWTRQCDGHHPPGPCPATSPEGWTQNPSTGEISYRDAAGNPRAGAAWLDPHPSTPPMTPLPDPLGVHPLGPPPPLPSFSAESCNAVLRGGPYDGQRTWMMPGTDTYSIATVGVYTATGETDGPDMVFVWQPPPRPPYS